MLTSFYGNLPLKPYVIWQLHRIVIHVQCTTLLDTRLRANHIRCIHLMQLIGAFVASLFLSFGIVFHINKQNLHEIDVRSEIEKDENEKEKNEFVTTIR